VSVWEVAGVQGDGEGRTPGKRPINILLFTGYFRLPGVSEEPMDIIKMMADWI
jgi:hypothetical protein